MAASTFVLEIHGLINSQKYAKVKYIALDLKHHFAPNVTKLTVHDYFEFQWTGFVQRKKNQLRGEVWGFDSSVMCFCNGEYVGDENDFDRLVNNNFDFVDFRNEFLYEALAKCDYKRAIAENDNEFVFLDMCIDGEYVGQVVIELFVKKVPKTCENFKRICMGQDNVSQNDYTISYKDTIIHRVVKKGWIQGGDFWFQSGDGGESVYGTTFEDENYTVRHDSRGVIGMCNKGRHSNGSQFYITLEPCPWLDKKFVAMGRVIEGSNVLESIEDLELENQRPLMPVEVTDCGIYVP